MQDLDKFRSGSKPEKEPENKTEHSKLLSKTKELYEKRLQLLKYDISLVDFLVSEGLSDVVKKFEDLTEKNSEESETINLSINELEASIKKEVLSMGKSQKTKYFSCTYKKGSTTWDSEKLKVELAKDKNFAKFQKVGKPSASLKIII